MLESLVYPTLPRRKSNACSIIDERGENVIGADNQQERLSCYVSGYVDGEGSFHIGLQRSENVLVGYQLVPEFHVSQNGERPEVLELILKLLGCGYVKRNHPGNENDQSMVLVVRKRK